MAVNEAADRYVRWLYRYASSRPDLSLLAGVAGAVAVLEDQPQDLVEMLHDELAIAMAAIVDRRPEFAIAMARLRPRSPVLTMALRHPAMRRPACVALANHLDNADVLAEYLALLTDPDQVVAGDALFGLEAFRGVRQPGPARARAVTRQLPDAVLSCVVDLLGGGNPALVASALLALEGRVLPSDLVARIVELLGHGDTAIAASARLVLEGRVLPDDIERGELAP